jgi:DNA-directed RNA polymerase subunit omega
MRNVFVQEALKKVDSPQILVNIISKRVRQLGQGFRPLVPVDPRWTFMDIALKEVGDGKLTFEMVESDAELTVSGRKNKKKKAA